MTISLSILLINIPDKVTDKEPPIETPSICLYSLLLAEKIQPVVTLCNKFLKMFSLLTFISEIHNLWTCKWILGLFLCKFVLPAIQITATMALGFILIISIERFYGIVYPFNQHITNTRIYIMIGINCLISLLVVIPGFVVNTVQGFSCTEKWGNQKYSLAYSWILFLVTFLKSTSYFSLFQ